MGSCSTGLQLPAYVGGEPPAARPLLAATAFVVVVAALLYLADALVVVALAVGAVVGSNIANVALILAVTALIHPVRVRSA